jgi:hypothetical protein
MRIKYFNTKELKWYDIPFSMVTFYNIISFGIQAGTVAKLTTYKA